MCHESVVRFCRLRQVLASVCSGPQILRQFSCRRKDHGGPRYFTANAVRPLHSLCTTTTSIQFRRAVICSLGTRVIQLMGTTKLPSIRPRVRPAAANVKTTAHRRLLLVVSLRRVMYCYRHDDTIQEPLQQAPHMDQCPCPGEDMVSLPTYSVLEGGPQATLRTTTATPYLNTTKSVQTKLTMIPYPLLVRQRLKIQISLLAR